MNNENFENRETEQAVDALCQWLRDNCPKTQMLVPERYGEVLRAKAALDLLLLQNGAEQSRMELRPLFSSASLIAEVDELEVGKPALFQRITEKASNFEIYPLLNGKIRLALVFYGVMKAIA